jgi:poly(beta-D-mannuronate) lyase
MSTRLFGRARRAPVTLASALLSLSFGTPAAAALDASLPPSGNFDLAHWKITLPSGSEIQPGPLSTGWTMDQVFYTHPTSGGMVFRCPNIAGTTANSNYSRTELREMLEPAAGTKSDANNWTMEEGGKMKARLKVDRVSTTGDSSKVGRVIVGQIHGADHEPVRLYFHKKPSEAKGRIYIASESHSGSTFWSTDIVTNKNGDGIALGELFTYQISLQGTRLQVDILRKQGTVVNTYIKTIDSAYAGENLYFKAGVYNQNNTGLASDYAQATFYTLTHTH